MIFILPPDENALAERLGRRGRDTADVTENRLDGASREIAAARQSYDNMVVNEDLEHAIGEVTQIVERALRGEKTTPEPDESIGDE